MQMANYTDENLKEEMIEETKALIEVEWQQIISKLSDMESSFEEMSSKLDNQETMETFRWIFELGFISGSSAAFDIAQDIYENDISLFEDLFEPK